MCLAIQHNGKRKQFIRYRWTTFQFGHVLPEIVKGKIFYWNELRAPSLAPSIKLKQI